jgi:hypothetical protein
MTKLIVRLKSVGLAHGTREFLPPNVNLSHHTNAFEALAFLAIRNVMQRLAETFRNGPRRNGRGGRWVESATGGTHETLPNTMFGCLTTRQCDVCRSRKIKCDRGAPCSNCRASKLSTYPLAPLSPVLGWTVYADPLRAMETTPFFIHLVTRVILPAQSQP